MKIIGIYSEVTKAYVANCLEHLKQLGAEAELLELHNYSGNINILSTPTFIIEKNGTYGYPLQGKQPTYKIEEWARQTGALCN